MHEKESLARTDASSGEGISAHTAAWPTAEELPFHHAAVAEITRAPRTASNYAPAAGAMHEGSFPKWMMTGKCLTHSSAAAPAGGGFLTMSTITDPLRALVWGILATAKDTLAAAGNSAIFTPVHYAWSVTLSAGVRQGLWDAAPVEPPHPSAQELANSAALKAQVTLSARLWEVTDSLVWAYETAVGAGDSTAHLEAAPLPALQAAQSHAGLRLKR